MFFYFNDTTIEISFIFFYILLIVFVMTAFPWLTVFGSLCM